MCRAHVELQRENAVAWVTLARPSLRNALNAELIEELRSCFAELGRDDAVRTIVIRGEGKVFCGGADVQWMRASVELTQEENLQEARALSRMFQTINRVPKLVLGRIHGAALGAGAGLAAVCDIAIASHGTLFGFTETKLGILPAVISPFVAAKIGQSHLRALALTGERFDAQRALSIGLIHELSTPQELDATLDRVIREALSASPTAIAAAKALFASLPHLPDDAAYERSARAIAAQRTSPEGQGGMRAFLEKKPAPWIP